MYSITGNKTFSIQNESTRNIQPIGQPPPWHKLHTWKGLNRSQSVQLFLGPHSGNAERGNDASVTA